MPTYEYICDPEDKGCGNLIQIKCSMSEMKDKKPKSCPKCKKKKAIRPVFGISIVHIPVTLGSLADKNSSNMSSDEKEYRTIKNNEYRNKGTSWECGSDGVMVHKNNR